MSKKTKILIRDCKLQGVISIIAGVISAFVFFNFFYLVAAFSLAIILNTLSYIVESLDNI